MRRKLELTQIAEALATDAPEVPVVTHWDRAFKTLQNIVIENVHGASIDWDEYEQMWTITVQQAGYTPDAYNSQCSFNVRTWRRFARDTSPMDLVAAAEKLYDELREMSNTMSRSLKD
jgi:hypothetical protein